MQAYQAVALYLGVAAVIVVLISIFIVAKLYPQAHYPEAAQAAPPAAPEPQAV